ncbi:hypothetical protein J4E93_006666 [Alternaria ventricosa]|uniref:uncharacterized protein n=1 Tax=Alternaria ventricosa TaxID=1187951 RepID=UPI0020C4F568|nr:uncharacterized protein J4E93_006666 [Alternaria ventricosa]KAI4643654.1 hypothetical protein J4E93_006666 [Alternaria ventricosa]
MFGSRVFPALALLLALTSIVGASGPTSIFIDQIEEYALLATCAELELSTIVRNMNRYDVDAINNVIAVIFLCFSSIDAAISIFNTYLNNTDLLN